MAKSIMIVDDNEMMRRNLRNLFSKTGDWAICAEAVDGRDAVEKARYLHPDFVVLDFRMPHMNGLQAASKLKDVSPKTSIVMLTAFKDRILEEEAYKVGISWVLSKDEATKVLDFARILLRPDPARALPAGNKPL
jgi:DNA-binding NarL/FixJ family response regulator